MKTLLLLRHAKAAAGDPEMRDHDRPLNKRGEQHAPRMGELLAQEELVPDLVLSSSAVRARTTAEIVTAAAGCSSGRIQVRESLYLSTPETIVDVVAQDAGDARRVLVVAHNPGLEEFVRRVSGRIEPFPTAAMAHFEVDVDDWAAFGLDTSLHCREVWRPREL